MTTRTPSAPYPLRLEGRLDPGLSRWLWLLKWVLAVPHAPVSPGPLFRAPLPTS